MANNAGFTSSGANPFNWIANKAAKYKGFNTDTSHPEKKYDYFAKRVIEKKVVNPPRMYGWSEDFGKGNFSKGYRAGLIRAMQEHVDARNQNLSAAQNAPAAPAQQPAAPAAPAGPSFSVTKSVQAKKEQDQQMKSKEAFSKPASSKTAKGIDILGPKGKRRGQKGERKVNQGKKKK